MSKKFGPPRPLGKKPLRAKMQGHQGELRFSLRLGEVVRVDYEKMLCDIQWIQGTTPPSREVPITSAYWSKRGFLGAMPEQGAIAVCGFSAVHENQGVRPYILAFLPNGYKTALGFDPMGVIERDDDEIDKPTEALQRELDGLYGPTRHKMRKLYPGDIYGASTKGAELLLDRDVRLFDADGSEFWLRAEDQSATLTTLDYYQTTGAGRHRSGRIIRNALTVPADFSAGEDGRIQPDTILFEHLVDAGIIFEDGTLTPDVNGLPFVTLESGERNAIVTENLRDPSHPEARAFTEDRLELQEFSDQQRGFPDHYGFDADILSDESHFTPFIERTVGTLVGNSAYTVRGRSNYGKILKPVVFNSPSSTTGQPRLEQVQNTEDEQEKNLAGAFLYRMQRPDGLGELFVSHDKEGHVFLSIPASTSKKSNLGAGRSLEADFKGSVKTVMGADKTDRLSFDLAAAGGLRWTIGSVASTGRSLDLTAKGGVALKVTQSDADGYAFKQELQGNVGESVEGSKGTSVSDDHLEEAGGKREIKAEKVSLSAGTGDFDVNSMSNQNKTIKGTVTKNIGQGRKTTIVSAPLTGSNAEELTILSGNRNTTFGAPATDTLSFASTGTKTVQAGGPLTCNWQTASSGEYNFRAASGTFSVQLGSGSISLVSGTGAVTITSGASANIEAPKIGLTGNVGLGQGASSPHAVIGGVAGPSPHLDYLTGLPLRGNPLVRTV